MSAIQHHRRRKQSTINTLHSGDGVLLPSTQNVVNLWGKYFENLNSTDAPSLEEIESGDSEVGFSISGVEVNEVFIKLLFVKAPRVDKIHPDFKKALDVVVLD